MKYKVTETQINKNRQTSIASVDFPISKDAQKYIEYIVNEYKNEGFIIEEVTLKRGEEKVTLKFSERGKDGDR